MAVLKLSIPAAALLAAVFSSHTLLAYPRVNQLEIAKNRAVTAVFGGILFTDTLVLVVLFAGVWFVVPPITRWFFQNLNEGSYFEFLYSGDEYVIQSEQRRGSR